MSIVMKSTGNMKDNEVKIDCGYSAYKIVGKDIYDMK